MKTVQLNATVPETAKKAVKSVARETGIKMEELLLDALKLLAGEEDSATKSRAKLFRQTCKLRGLHVL
jgi:hypothetical protein